MQLAWYALGQCIGHHSQLDTLLIDEALRPQRAVGFRLCAILVLLEIAKALCQAARATWGAS